jgi:hypothetical protein
MTYRMNDINGMLRRTLTARGIAHELKYIDDQGGRMVWIIDGQQFTPGEACDRYLPGGFAGNFGKVVDR